MPTLMQKKLSSKRKYKIEKENEKKIRSMDKADKDKWKWTMQEKFNEEVELDREKVKKIVPQKFHK